MGSGCIDPHILNLGASYEVSGQLHAPGAFPAEKQPRYPLDRGLDGPQNPIGTRTPTPRPSSR
jgi:hypothetical protein